jgi:predicted metalloprotease
MQLGRQSDNVEDRRGMRAGLGGGVGRVSGLGLGGVLVLLALGWLMTGDPLGFLGGGGVPVDSTAPSSSGPPTDPGGVFASQVLADTEDSWNELFRASGQRYQPPKLVLFSGAVDSACGTNSSAVGPFYCPGDQRVYIDLTFFHELDQRFGAPGDFAQAYVIAHEVGHHVQNLTGVFENARRSASRADANALSVAQELQADCYAGVWGFYAAKRGVLQPGDAEEGLRAAAAIGDDRIQRRTQGQVTPETWTHGSSDQRVRWLRTGMESGKPSACDTLSGR